MKQEDISQFDSYISGEMDANQRLSFESRLQEDVAFTDSFSRYLQTVRLIKSYGILADLDAIHAGERKKTKGIWFLPYWSLIAIGLILLSLLVWFNLEEDGIDDLVSAYFIPYTDVITSRGEALDEAMIHYSSGEFQNAFEILSNQPVVSDTVLLYLVNCSLAEEQLEVPEVWSMKIDSLAKTSVFSQQFKWYGSLYFLKDQKTSRALDLLSGIRPGEFHYDEARALSVQLQKKL